MKFVSRLLPTVLLLLTFSGCFFDHPLTTSATKDINTWLLGVWESQDEKGRTSRIMVTPMEEDRYAVHATLPGKRPKETRKYEFEAWPSRVGGTVFLTMLCLQSDGDIPHGSYVFGQVQLLDQNHARTHGLNLESPSSATSYELRQEVRSKLKENSLYEGAPSATWTRVAEVFWSTDGSDPVFKPIRNPGNVVVSPDLKDRDPSEKIIGNSSR